jgi:hypothetical protein
LVAVVEIDIQSSEGCTSLEYAILHNKPSIVKYLLENGADANNPNSREQALHAACSFYVIPKVHNDVSCILSPDSSYRKVYDINSEIVKMLLDNGADVHYTDNYSNTALNVARMNRAHPEASNSSYDAVIALLTDAMKFKIAGPFKTIDSPITCPICLGDQGQFCHLNCCSHSYHVHCLKKWFEMETSNKKCPTCRSALKSARPVKK